MNITEKQRQLSGIIDERLSELDLPTEPALLYDPIRYTLDLAGKRVRPYLTLIGCGLCDGNVEEALPAAISIELLHNFTLLHDDIMDRAEKRRGELSVYKKWDDSTAILSGDAMYARAFKQLQYYGQSDSYSKDRYRLILDLFLECTEAVCEGQAFDLMFERGQNITIEEYIGMIEGKTAALISGSLALGGAVANASDELIEELQFVGKKIGIAFQIQDDLLDVIADPEKFGKKRGGDIIEGKKTYLALLALQRCDDHQKENLAKYMASSSNSIEEIDEVISLYESLDVISDTKNAISYHYEAAMEHLADFKDSDYKQELIEFLNRLISREY